MPLPKSIQCPPQVNDTILYTVNDHNEEMFNKLGKYTQGLIEGSAEWNKQTVFK